MNFKELSDAALRNQPLPRRFPHMPSSETTRKRITNILKNHQKTKNSPYTTLKTYALKRGKSRVKTDGTDIQCTSKNKYETIVDKLNAHSIRSTMECVGSSPLCCSNKRDVSRKNRSKIYVSPLIMSDDETNRNNTQVVKNERNSDKCHLYSRNLETNGQSVSRQRTLTNKQNQDRSDLIFKKLNPTIAKNASKRSSVLYYLIASCSLLFLILYYYLVYKMKPLDLSSNILKDSTIFTTCKDFKQLPELTEINLPSVNCIESDILSDALDFTRDLMKMLHDNTVTHYCQDRSIRLEISAANFINCTYKKISNDIQQMLRLFHAALYLMKKNPQWNILIVNESESDALPDFYNENIRFKLLKPQLPLTCVLSNNLREFFCLIGTISLVAICYLVCFGVYQFIKGRYKYRSKTVQYFMEKIIQELLQKSSNTEIIVNHLRDNILMHNEKKHTLLWAWNEAVSKLESTDSRIQFNTTVYNGEEYRTIKWVECHRSTLQEDLRCKKEAVD